MTFITILKELDGVFRSRLEPLTRQTRAAWQQRSAQEQAFLRGGAILLVLLLLWLVALRPALQTVRTARQQLPGLQAQTARLGAVLLEAQVLTVRRSGTMSVSDVEQALQTSLRAAGLEMVSILSSADGAAAKETLWQVQFVNAPAGSVLEWMASLPLVAQTQTRSVDLARSNVDGRDRPGQLSGSVVLALTPPGESS